ncbi:UNVERIFIED_CONTAM: hypothetical protein PYX00_004162 [Menopon gallinae]|uniref:Homeobox domain-containing protein n=1 Tax=Menopon gallinae TaxID=328185 RepID=A0AAW2I354_9NEOP
MLCFSFSILFLAYTFFVLFFLFIYIYFFWYTYIYRFCNRVPRRKHSSGANGVRFCVSVVVGVKRREETATGGSQQITADHNSAPKKPRLVFTDLQRRTLQAIFKETKRPSKEMQVTIARQLGLEPTTVGNFFMNARRRSMDKWRDEEPGKEESPSSSGVATSVASGIQHTTVLQSAGGGHEEL